MDQIKTKSAYVTCNQERRLSVQKIRFAISIDFEVEKRFSAEN